MKDDFAKRPISYVLSPEGQAKYAQTFSYLAGEPLDWAARGLARLETIELQEDAEL